MFHVEHRRQQIRPELLSTLGTLLLPAHLLHPHWSRSKGTTHASSHRWCKKHSAKEKREGLAASKSGGAADGCASGNACPNKSYVGFLCRFAFAWPLLGGVAAVGPKLSIADRLLHSQWFSGRFDHSLAGTGAATGCST